MADSKRHGTYAGYKVDGCRCVLCRKASSAYAKRRERQIGYGRWQPFVDAAPVRAHVEALQAAGLGWKRLADLAGVSRGAVDKLLHGAPHRNIAPTKRMRPEAAARILAVKPDLDLLGDRALVDATGSRRRVQALVARGWSLAKLARELGVDPTNLPTMIRRDRMHAETVRAIRGLYDRLWASPPPETEWRDKISASRARNYAAARGWVLPMAWDDHDIDNPAAKPQSTGPAARARLPQGDELLRLVRLGETDEALAMRFDVAIVTVQQARHRAAKKEAVAA
jgi:hypothetical protein